MAVAAWEGQHDMFGSMFFGGGGPTGQPPRPGDASVRGMPIDVIEMTGAPGCNIATLAAQRRAIRRQMIHAHVRTSQTRHRSQADCLGW